MEAVSCKETQWNTEDKNAIYFPATGSNTAKNEKLDATRDI